jgi:hypothetical protein
MDFARHFGASFVAGADQVHIWAERADEPALSSSWKRYLADPGIAQPLTIGSEANGRIHAHAACYPFLPIRLLQRIIEPGASSDTTALENELSEHAYDASVVEDTYAIHRRLALKRGWPAWPLMLGRMPALILGAGRHHCLVPMNLAPAATALVGLASQNKAFGRDVLAAYGLPSAPGGVASTPELAVSQAQRVGWPVVLKRLSGGNSDGVILNIAGEDECRSAAAELLAGGGAILVEKRIAGIELRVHFVAGRIQEIVLRVPDSAIADGKSSLRHLIAHARPNYLKLADRSTMFQRQLVYRLWELGVRTFADIDRIVLPEGGKVSLGKDFHRFRDAATEARALHPSDRRRIEAFLTVCGKPSGALDLIVAHAGTPLSDGGAVLEINVPSGMWYLNGIDQVVQRELNAWTAHMPSFKRQRGRVPFWIVAGRTNGPRQVQDSFKTRFPGGKALNFQEIGNWAPILTESAEALLVFVEDEDIRRNGLPLNLAPTVWIEGTRAQFRLDNPYLAATLDHAGPGVRYRRIRAA